MEENKELFNLNKSILCEQYYNSSKTIMKSYKILDIHQVIYDCFEGFIFLVEWDLSDNQTNLYSSYEPLSSLIPYAWRLVYKVLKNHFNSDISNNHKTLDNNIEGIKFNNWSFILPSPYQPLLKWADSLSQNKIIHSIIRKYSFPKEKNHSIKIKTIIRENKVNISSTSIDLKPIGVFSNEVLNAYKENKTQKNKRNRTELDSTDDTYKTPLSSKYFVVFNYVNSITQNKKDNLVDKIDTEINILNNAIKVNDFTLESKNISNQNFKISLQHFRIIYPQILIDYLCQNLFIIQ